MNSSASQDAILLPVYAEIASDMLRRQHAFKMYHYG